MDELEYNQALAKIDTRLTILEREVLGNGGPGLKAAVLTLTEEFREYLHTGRLGTCYYMKSKEASWKRRARAAKDIGVLLGLTTLILRVLGVI